MAASSAKSWKAQKYNEVEKELNSKTPFVFFQFLVVKPNEHQVEDIKRLAMEVGVDEVRFKTAQVYEYETDPNNLIPSMDKFSRYKKMRMEATVPKTNWPTGAGKCSTPM